MGMPVVVVNWDELVAAISDSLTVNVGDVDLSTEKLENILNKYFPQIIELLKLLLEQKESIKGTQKVKGIRINFNEDDETSKRYIFEATENILLTGFSFSQNNFHSGSWDVFVVKDDDTKINIIDNLYSKDSLQHKYFNVFMPIPTGYKIEVVINNPNNIRSTFWCDLEYLTGVVLKPDTEIDHDYDILIRLRWENNTEVDMDMKVYVDGDRDKRVEYNHKKYIEDDLNRMWLDYDYRDQGDVSKDEIVTVLGMLGRTISIEVNKFNNRELTENISVIVELGNGIKRTIVVPREKFSSSNVKVHICDIIGNLIMEKL